MNLFAGEGIAVQHEAEVRVLEVGMVAEEVAGEAPQAAVELLERAAFLVDPRDALLEIHARFDRTEDFIAGAEDAVEKTELLVQQLVDALVGGIGLVEEVHHDHVELLVGHREAV